MNHLLPLCSSRGHSSHHTDGMHVVPVARARKNRFADIMLRCNISLAIFDGSPAMTSLGCAELHLAARNSVSSVMNRRSGVAVTFAYDSARSRIGAFSHASNIGKRFVSCLMGYKGGNGPRRPRIGVLTLRLIICQDSRSPEWSHEEAR